MSTKKGICCLGEIVVGLAILFVAIFTVKAAGKSKKLNEEMTNNDAPESGEPAPTAEASGKTDIGI